MKAGAASLATGLNDNSYISQPNKWKRHQQCPAGCYEGRIKFFVSVYSAHFIAVITVLLSGPSPSLQMARKEIKSNSVSPVICMFKPSHNAKDIVSQTGVNLNTINQSSKSTIQSSHILKFKLFPCRLKLILALLHIG